MAEATPADWTDLCDRCGRGFAPGEPRWIEQRTRTVHTHCADWTSWDKPPYSWKLKELRRRYRNADADSRARIARAGRAIRAAQLAWPAEAEAHVRRVLEAVLDLGL